MPAVTVQAVVEARGLFKSYATADGRTIEVLRGISCMFEQGEMTALVGPSGSGKSTALLCLSGIEQATSGFVEIFGRDLGVCSPREIASLYRTRVGFVFQAYNLIPYLTVSENIRISTILSGSRTDEPRLQQVLAQLGLVHRCNTSVTTLSGGEQQRVALGRVLYQQPPLIFADEPTGALDTRSAAFVLGELRRLADTGTSVVLVTHDLSAAVRADSVMVMRDGVVTDTYRGVTESKLVNALGGAGGHDD